MNYWLLTLAWFIFFVVLHISIFHLFSKVSRAKVLINTFKLALLGLTVSLTFYIAAFPELNNSIPEATLIYVYCVALLISLFILYMPFYYTISSSLSVQSLIMIADVNKEDSQMETSMLINHFTSKSLISNRLQLMADNGYLLISGDSYELRPKGRKFAIFFNKLKHLWRLGSGG